MITSWTALVHMELKIWAPVFWAGNLDTKERITLWPTPALSHKALTSKLTLELRQQLLNTQVLRQSEKARWEKRERKAHYQTASEVLRELVDRDLGFIIILILEKKKREKERRKVFWLIHLSCLSTKTVLNIFHFQGALLAEIQTAWSPTPAPPPPVRNIGTLLRHKSPLLLHAEFTPALGCSEVTDFFCLFALPREELNFESILHLVTRESNAVKEPLDLVILANP